MEAKIKEIPVTVKWLKSMFSGADYITITKFLHDQVNNRPTEHLFLQGTTFYMNFFTAWLGALDNPPKKEVNPAALRRRGKKRAITTCRIRSYDAAPFRLIELRAPIESATFMELIEELAALHELMHEHSYTFLLEICL